jgi:hypothetical protein
MTKIYLTQIKIRKKNIITFEIKKNSFLRLTFIKCGCHYQAKLQMLEFVSDLENCFSHFIKSEPFI